VLKKQLSRLAQSVTYQDFISLWRFKKNVENFDQPAGLTFSDNSFIRYISFAALYFAQGIPGGLLHFAIPAWMATVDYTAMDVGKYLAIVTLPWSFKLIAAPIMDRFTFLPMGRRRPWLIGGQLGIVLGLIAFSTINDPENNLLMLMAFGFIVNVFTIFQDIATDGLAIDVLPVHQQARANGLMWGSKTIGVSVIVAVTLLLFNGIGFNSTIILFGIMVGVIMLLPILVKERPEEKRLPWTKGTVSEKVLELQVPNWKILLKNLFKVFFLPVSILMGVAAFSLSIFIGFMDAALPIFTVQKMGWADNQFPEVLSSSKLIGGIVGMLIGGAMIDIIGKIKMISWLIGITIAILIAFVFLQPYWAEPFAINIFILGYQVFNVLMTIVIFAIAMQLCWKQIAATQFTLYMTIANLGQSLGSYIFGYSEQFLDWQYIFLLNILFLVIMFITVRFIDFDKHKTQLESLKAFSSS
jgi:PAT family beta-lactamase induction signal transducer AmpG